MKDISVRDIVNETCGKLLQGPEDLLLTSVTTDSRTVGENALFVGISGETMDGNRFAASAVENGAKAAMISDARVYPGGQHHRRDPADGADGAAPHSGSGSRRDRFCRKNHYPGNDRLRLVRGEESIPDFQKL